MIAAVMAALLTADSPIVWPGPYAGARILGGGDVCAVYTEDPVRSTADERGIVHYYVAGYAEDYIAALYPSFGIGGAWEDARGAPGRPRAAGDLAIGGGEIEATAAYRSILDPDLWISYRVFPTRPGTAGTGAIVFEAEIRNGGAAPREVVVRPVVRFRGTPDSLEAWSDEKGTATALFPLARLDLRFVGDRNVHAVRAAPGDFPSVEVPVTVAPGSAARAAFALVGTAAGAAAPPPDDGDLTFDAARAAWEAWWREGDEPPAGTAAPLRAAFRAALAATDAVNLRGAVPADVTGQFVTEGRPQLYPRDALMTARALLEAGHAAEAAEIVRFWDARIPQKSPGEWYARYDARTRATPGGSGAAHDVPEWDSNGYYASLLLALYMRTGRWEGDFDLMKALLDFVVERQGRDGLVEEGGIVEWPGRLPATNMTVAAGLRHGALVCEIRGDPVSARRYRVAAWRMERGLARLLDPARGAYVDSRLAGTGFDASANFGFVWGFPDHLGLALTNAWYRRHAVRLGGGVQYFEAEGYGDDLFGFTTAAAARYHAEAGDPEAYAAHVRWLAERTNRYGLFPERIVFPGGAEVSEASPLSWCGAEFAAALLAGARVGDPAAGGDRAYALSSLVSAVEGLGRVLAALPPEPPITRLEALSRRVSIVGREDRPWEERLRIIRAALDEMREVAGPEVTGEALDDVRPMIERLLLVADRIVRNAAGADVRLRLDTPAVAGGVEARLNVAVESGPDVVWRTFAVEHLDGNSAWRRRVYPIPPDALPTNIPVLFEREGPYEAAIRVTARGEWKGIPFGLARTVSLDLLERHTGSTAESHR